MASQDQLSDLQRQIDELKAASKTFQKQAAVERREKEAAQAQAEIYRCRVEAAQAREENVRREEELLQQENSLTTLHDYLRNCHKHLYNNLRLAPKSLSTTGNTSVTGKFYPKVLLPWATFETDIVPRHFDVIDKICGDVQAFPGKSSVVGMGSSIVHKVDDNESFIKYFQTFAVNLPVMEIIQFASSREEFQTRYDTTRVSFSLRGSEITQSDRAASDDEASKAGPEQRVVLKATPKPAGIGLRTRNNGDKCLAFVCDYKEACKVDVAYAREAVANTHLFDEIVQRINSAQVITDDTVRRREDAESSIATSLVQVYDYMVTFGVAYGYVASGNTLLLMYVDRNNPETLYCHPCMPLDLADPIDGSIDPSRTAVAQMLCFCLQAFQSDAHPGSGRSLDTAFVKTVTSVNMWPVPYMDAPRAGLQSLASKTGGVLPRRDLDHKDDVDGEDGDVGNESRSTRRTSPSQVKKNDPSSSGDNSPDDNSDDSPTRQYCTQACLLGLQRGHDLDENCPNVMLHRDGRADVSRHLLDAGQFAGLMGQQLRRDPYHKCALVNYWTKGGAMGWMFKLELLPYGYTLVGKGTVAGRGARLEHEGRIYERLASLQGHLVPVHLGLINMGRGYIIPGFRFVVHMMLMSWAGEALDYEADKTLEDKTRVAANTMWRAGVDHGDDCPANYVWNAERGCIMIIDFDHASLLPMPKPKAVDALLRFKRKKGVKADGVCKRRAQPKSQRPRSA